MHYSVTVYQIRGTMSMEPVENGDVWTFLNRVKRELENSKNIFSLTWANAYLQPYTPDDGENFLTLKVRGIGVVYNVDYANDKMATIIIDAAEASNLFVGGGFGFEKCG